MISCQTLTQILEKRAPKKLAADWDNPGLAVGSLSRSVSKVLLTLTVTYETVDFAVKNGFDIIISHHPLIFKPLKSVNKETVLGKIIYEAIKNDIVIYSAHTNLDVANEGINDILAENFELQKVSVLKPTYEERLKKLVVFVPRGYENEVRNAICSAGAGFIGKYSNCTFNVEGVGTFKPSSGSKPFIGEVGKLERADEIRIETIFPESLQKKVLNAMLKAHPYEEVAFDIYPLENQGNVLGFGRIGYTKEPLLLKQFCEIVKQKLGALHIRAVGDLNKNICKVAVCGGAGSEFINQAAFLGADVIVTGDVKYHDALDAKAMGIAVIDAGHFSTENIVLPAIKKYLEEQIKLLNKQVEISIYEDVEPFVFI